MIKIVDFETDYFTSEMRRKKVKNPRWFKCPVNDSPEMQMILCCDPNDKTLGLAILGLWEQMQRWCVRNIKKMGCFVLKGGNPMNLSQIAYALHLEGDEQFVAKAIEVLVQVGWLEEIQCGLVLTPVEEDEPPPSPSPPRKKQVKKLPPAEPEKAERTPSTVAKIDDCMRALQDGDSPMAIENPALIEEELALAIAANRDLQQIVEAMLLYYSLEVGKGKFRVRPKGFIANKKEIENHDTWFNELEAKKYKNNILRKVNEERGGGNDDFCKLVRKFDDKTPMQLKEIHNQWTKKQVAELSI